MKNITNILILSLIFLFFNSCGTLKEGFVSPKKNSSDEFLVKKKSPLVMPPEFGELPIPENRNKKNENDQKEEIKSMITNNDNSSSKSQNKTNQNRSFEISILEKIKNN